MTVVEINVNELADKYRYVGGFNLLPSVGANPGGILEKYAHLLRKPIEELNHNFWNKNGDYNHGIVMINGKAPHRQDGQDLWTATFDVDSERGAKIIFDLFGCDNLEQLSEIGIVGKHPGTPRFHLTVYSDGEFPSLSPNDSGIEIKGTGQTITMPPTTCKDGSIRELVGVSLNTMANPRIAKHEKLIEKLGEALKLFGVIYGNGKASGNINPISINREKIPKGQRHPKLVSKANSLIALLHKKDNRETIQKYFETWNQQECEPPMGSEGPQQQEELKELRQIFDDSWNNIVTSNQEYKVEKGNGEANKEHQQKILSVLEAKRLHSGYITVRGTIVSVTDMYVLENTNKDTVEYNNAKSIKLEDINKKDYNERLDVVLYNEMVDKVIVGERVQISGNIRVEDKKPNNKSKKKFNVLHASSIVYLNKKEITVTNTDIEAFEKFTKLPIMNCRWKNCNCDYKYNLINRLAAMYAPNIIGHEDRKRGVLRSIVGGIYHSEKNDGRISTLMVGDPGTAKSELGKDAVKIKPNSRHVSAPHATTKGLIAVPERMPDGTAALVVGAIPLCSGGICSIDEINTFPMDDQSRILDVLDNGGKVHIDKMGISAEISALTTIIATANPIGGKWDNPQVATRQEVDIRNTLMDRITQVYASRDNMNDGQTKEFVKLKNKIRKRRPHNYNFLRKYLIYASGIKDIKITKVAEDKLSQFWVDGKIQDLLSIRMYDGIFKMAEAQAKLHLTNIIDGKIVDEVIQDIKLMMVQYGEVIKNTLTPHEVAYNTCLEILRKSKVGMDIKSIRDLAVIENDQVASYFGDVWKIDENIKVRQVIDSLEESSKH